MTASNTIRLLKYALIVSQMYLPTNALADVAITKSNISVMPSDIKPDVNGIIRFAIGVNNIPEPGLTSFALDVVFSGPVNLVSTLQYEADAPIPADKVTCSSSVAASAPTETIIPNVLIQLQSGLGNFILDGKGSGALLTLKNELVGNVGRYAFGVAGDKNTVSPQTGNGSLIEFRCMAGENVPKTAQISVEPKLITGTTGALYLFGEGNPIESDMSSGAMQLVGGGNPIVTQNDSIDVRAAEVITIAVLANDTAPEDGQPVGELVIKSSPMNGVAVVEGQQISYTPQNNFVGTDSFTYAIKDSLGFESNEATVTVNVGAVNSVPVANADVAETQEDIPTTILVIANDTDVDNDVLTVVSVTQPGHGSAVINGTNIVYTPHENYHGSDSFSYVASDGKNDSASAYISVSISAVNDLPLAAKDSATVQEDQSINIDVLSNDTDVDQDTLSIIAVSQGHHGQVSLVSNQVAYLPNPDFNGNDSFTYTVSDGKGGQTDGNVTVSVASVNDAPIARIDVPLHNVISDALIADGSGSFDVDRDAIKFDWSLLTPAGSQAKLSLANVSKPLFTPDLVGDYTLKLIVTDMVGEENSTELTIHADDPLLGNIAPNAKILPITKQVPVNTLLDIDGASSQDPDQSPNPQLSYQWQLIQRPSGSDAELANSTQSLSSLIPDMEGEYQVRLSVFDGADQKSTDMIVSAVSGNTVPFADAGEDQTLINGEMVTLSAAASKDANDAFTDLLFRWMVVKAPEGSTMSNAIFSDSQKSELNVIPDKTGEYLFRLDVKDTQDKTDFDQVVVTVNLNGDLDFDNDIDMNDLALFKVSPVDVNKDGVLNSLDYRAAILLCTRPKCAVQ